MASTINLNALGLITNPNQLQVPPGSMVEATNIVIDRQNIVEPRRGYALEGTEFGTSLDRAKQLLVYKDRILRHYSNQLQFETLQINDDSETVYQTFSGNFSEVQSGLRIKGIEANKNFYFTTDDGIKKISARSGDDFSTDTGFITNSGGIKAINNSAKITTTLGNSSGFLPQDSAVAYRVVWGIKDLNNNLILGTPSDRTIVYNPLFDLLIKDFNNLLGSLDNLDQSTSLITDGNYTSTLFLTLDNDATELRANLLSLATKLDGDIEITEGAINTATTQRTTTTNLQLIFSASVSSYIAVGDKLILSGFATSDLNGKIITVTSVASTTINGTPTVAFAGTDGAPVADVTGVVNSYNYRNIAQPIAVTDPTNNLQLLSLQTYLSDIIIRLQVELSGVIPTLLKTEFIDPLDVTTTSSVSLTINLPEEITTDYFYQIYRSPISQALDTTSIDDIFPSDELQLIYENYPTASDITNGYVLYLDNIPESFLGANLYTNEVSGEGILQSNDLPPIAKDINRFKGHLFFANTKTRNRFSSALLGISDLIDQYNLSLNPKINIIDENNVSNSYEFIVGIKESTPITVPTVASVPVSGYFTLDTPSSAYYVWYDTTGTDPDPAVSGRTGIRVLLGGLGLVSANQLAQRTADVLNQYSDLFTASAALAVVTITNVDEGYADDATLGAGMSVAGFSIGVITQGQGELAAKDINEIVTVADVAGSLAGTAVLLNSLHNTNLYYFWFRVGLSGTDPNIAGRIGFQVNINTNDSANAVATALNNAINTNVGDYFNSSVLTNTITVETVGIGPANNPANGAPSPGFTYNSVQEGAAKVLLSSSISPAIALEETTKSLINVINKNQQETVYAYYLSGPLDKPGLFLLESKTLADQPFALLASDSVVGETFNPIISPEFTITSISAASSSVITTSTNHGLSNGDQVVLGLTNSIPSVDGTYTVSSVTPTTFVIQKEVITAGTSGVVSTIEFIEGSDNEEKPNRVYYSKFQEPESVPILNYIDVGGETDEILRIFPLRDSLFVFKKNEGLFRISGETSPFNLALFDSSTNLIAPDSLGLVDTVIYGWFKSGICSVSEAGSNIVSKVIDEDVRKLQSDQYPNFSMVTWGIGYESDNCYLVWTNSDPEDEYATFAYRYSTVTNAWSIYSKSNTCGVLNTKDDRLYLGVTDINRIEKERKTFSRLDFCDRQFDSTLEDNKILLDGKRLKFLDVSNIVKGDVIVQNQTLTTYEFNRLLEKIDIDPTIAYVDITSITTGTTPTVTTAIGHNLVTGDYVELNNTDCDPPITGVFQATVLSPTTFTIEPELAVTTAGTSGKARLNYFNTLEAVNGDNLKDKLVEFCQKLDTDPGVNDTDYESSIIQKNGTITSISAASQSIITTAAPHGLFTGRIITISNSDSSPLVDGRFEVTVISPTIFSIDKEVLTVGTTGTFVTQDTRFDDLEACYNYIMEKLNGDLGVTFNNYVSIDNNSMIEAIVTSVNKVSKEVDLHIALPFIVGDVTIFKSIPMSFTYSQINNGDPVSLKHFYEAQMLFEDKKFFEATLSFGSDLLPSFDDVTLIGDSNGIFGHQKFGPINFFGGNSHNAPIRTYIPRNKQRCRHLYLKFSHSIARENCRIYGCTLTLNDQATSTRAYR